MCVSIIIPTYNDSRYLHKCITSAIEQDVEKEIIVIDDASTIPFPSNVQSLIRDHNIRVIRHEKNSGLSASRNTGIAQSKYNLFLPLDADDYLYPNVLGRMVKEMGDFDVVHGNVYDTGGGGYIALPVREEIQKHHFLDRNPIFCSSLWRKKVWEAEPPAYQMSGKYLVLQHAHYEDYRFNAVAFRNGFKFKYVDVNVYVKLNRPDSMLYQLHDKTKEFKNIALAGVFD